MGTVGLTVAGSSALTIRRMVIERVGDGHRTLTCIVSPTVPGLMAEVVELATDPVVSSAATCRW
jgi:hypothetical protein